MTVYNARGCHTITDTFDYRYVHVSVAMFTLVESNVLYRTPSIQARTAAIIRIQWYETCKYTFGCVRCVERVSVTGLELRPLAHWRSLTTDYRTPGAMSANWLCALIQFGTWSMRRYKSKTAHPWVCRSMYTINASNNMSRHQRALCLLVRQLVRIPIQTYNERLLMIGHLVITLLRDRLNHVASFLK